MEACRKEWTVIYRFSLWLGCPPQGPDVTHMAPPPPQGPEDATDAHPPPSHGKAFSLNLHPAPTSREAPDHEEPQHQHHMIHPARAGREVLWPSLRYKLLQSLATPFPLRGMQTLVHTQARTQMFTAARACE